MKKQSQNGYGRRRRGFERTSGLLQDQIRSVGESRGFSVSRVLTHWQDIVGPETAQTATPVKVGYSRGGLGATLTLLTTGAHAPILQAQLPKIREKVNACYGYAAISHVRITQSAATGFRDGQVAFAPAPGPEPKRTDPKLTDKAKLAARAIDDGPLRTALEALGENVLTHAKSNEVPE